MEEFDIREATPEDAEKIIAYLAQVGGETDYLSFGKEGLPISIEEEEKFIPQKRQPAGSHGITGGIKESSQRGDPLRPCGHGDLR